MLPVRGLNVKLVCAKNKLYKKTNYLTNKNVCAFRFLGSVRTRVRCIRPLGPTAHLF
uniref:Uncharacterized protein n=1 Tax=Anguilla anguilla TaxID=7936 RepID=A0A0E9R4Y9_ANGAN